MKKVCIEDAVGMVLAHDITRIIPGKFKGVGFEKGHIVREEDIPELLKLGKRHLYILDLSADQLHEDEAALRIAKAVCGEGIRWTDPREGKSNIVAKTAGLLKINAEGLLKINRMESIVLATLKTDFPCQADQTVAATRIIPLTIEREKIETLERVAAASHPVIQVLPYRHLKVAAIVTGDEMYNGLIPDGFDEFVGVKIRHGGSEIIKKTLVPDDPKAIADAIRASVAIGSDLILTTGGLSVDPDDATRNGIQEAGADIILYGAPILPGAMFLYALLDGVPILGLPACVYYHPTTVFDLVLPRILTGDAITPDEISGMGHGGLCMSCEVCQYPICPFGK